MLRVFFWVWQQQFTFNQEVMSSWNLIYRLFPKIRSLDYFLSILFCTISPKLFKGIKNA